MATPPFRGCKPTGATLRRTHASLILMGKCRLAPMSKRPLAYTSVASGLLPASRSLHSLNLVLEPFIVLIKNLEPFLICIDVDLFLMKTLTRKRLQKKHNVTNRQPKEKHPPPSWSWRSLPFSTPIRPNPTPIPFHPAMQMVQCQVLECATGFFPDTVPYRSHIRALSTNKH